MSELEPTIQEPGGYGLGSEDEGRSRRRRLGPTVVVLMAMTATVAGMLITRPESGDTLKAGSNANLPIIGQAGPALPPGVELTLAEGWQTLRADGEVLVVGTHPLGGPDLVLAALARADAVFSDFPPDGAVLVVGGDRLTAKYLNDPAQATRSTIVAGGVGGESVELGPEAVIAPGPPLGLGPATALAGGVEVRRGDVPKSALTLAAYIGSQAPATASGEAEAMAATVHLIASAPGVIPPPPPAGSRPGFDSGGVDVPPDRLAAAVSVDAPGVTYAVRAGADCAVIVASGSTQPVGGGCRPRPSDEAPAAVVAVLADRGPPPLPPPGESFAPGYVARWPQAMVVLARVGADARRTAAATDGRPRELPGRASSRGGQSGFGERGIQYSAGPVIRTTASVEADVRFASRLVGG